MPQAINELKEQFQTAVNNKIKQSGKDRLVIFIDDLDRLHPGKAVELLEVLKLFLDCDNCVFVLAIDYAVVSQGVKQKYGELIGEEKGKSFFDKIIQVPFKMPVAQYNVKNYVISSLNALGISVADLEVESYVKLIQRSVGCNPRAMKRLFNAFLLLNKIAANGTVIDAAQRKMLFAILCLQLSFENIYNYIVQNAEDCHDGNMLQSLANPETYTEGSDAERLSHQLQLHSDA
jgi:predicted KAP-like P-loop ATPase